MTRNTDANETVEAYLFDNTDVDADAYHVRGYNNCDDFVTVVISATASTCASAKVYKALEDSERFRISKVEDHGENLGSGYMDVRFENR